VAGRAENLKPPFPVLQLTHIMDRGGGAEEVVANIARRLDRDLFRPIVGCLWWGGTYADELVEEGFDVFILGQKDVGPLRAHRKLTDLFRRERVVICHTHMFMSNAWGRVAALRARVPVVVATEHLVREFINPGKHLVPDLLLSWATDRIVTVSERVRQSYLSGSGISPKKLVTIYNGIDIDRFTEAEPDAALRPELGLDGAGPVVGVVARFVEQKGHVHLLEAAREVVRERPDVRFLLLGDGPLRGLLIERAREYGIADNLIFAGIRHDMPRVYPHMDVSVLSSLAEGFSITLLESMASGIPAVVTDVGGNREIVDDGENGFLVPPGSPRALADRILLLLGDPGRRKLMGSRARRRVVEGGFTVHQFIRNTEALYEGLLREKGIL
jgi:glycosyltransferase involved in cell wall biosynthesis